TSSSRTNTFDTAGQLSNVVYSGGGYRTLDYDDLGRLTGDQMHTSGGTITAGNTYGYDADNHVTTRSDNLPGNSAAGINTYSYDNAGRVATWTNPATTTVNYTYDDAGNLTNNAGTTATYDQRNQLLSSGTTSY